MPVETKEKIDEDAIINKTLTIKHCLNRANKFAEKYNYNYAYLRRLLQDLKGDVDLIQKMIGELMEILNPAKKTEGNK